MLPALPTPASTAFLRRARGFLSGRTGSAGSSAPWSRGGGLCALLAGARAGVARGLGEVARALGSRPLARLLTPLLLVALLAGCGSTSQPPRRVVLDALALQIRLTQDQVAQALRLEPSGVPEVSRVRVEEQQPVTIGEARGLRLTGRFDWRLAEDPIRVDSPFQIYLQRGERGQSWRLARPLAGSPDGNQDWITEPLPLPGERGSRPAAAPASGSGGAG